MNHQSGNVVPVIRVQPDPHPQRPSQFHPSPAGDGTEKPTVIDYSPADSELPLDCSPLLALQLFAVPAVLTVLAGWIVGSAAQDSDPFAPSFRQSFLYAFLAPSLTVLWAVWATAWLVLIFRRRLRALLALPLALLALWGGVVCLGLYQITGEFIDQTSRFHGARWPILERIF